MNKTFKILTTMVLACLMFCGTALAAPRGGRGRGHAPGQAPRHHVGRRHHAPGHHAPKCRPAPKPHKVWHHHRHHHRPLQMFRCCRYQHNVYDCLCCLPAQRIVIWR